MTTLTNRLIYNADWGAMFWSPNLWQPEGGPYSARAMHRFAELVAASGVDTVALSPNTQIAWYPSQVVPTALDGYTRDDPAWAHWFRAHPPETNLAMMNEYLDLAAAGVDWLAAAISACVQRGMTPWISVRTNDPHGYLERWVDNPINCPLFRDPANRLRGTPLRPGKHADVLWVGLNYERPAVREYFLTMIRELVQDYDAQGLELDFLRTPAICEPGASQATIDAITDWIGQVRALTAAKAAATRRPCPLGLRLPGALAALREIGLDVQAVVDAGLVDFLSFSNYMQTPWAMPLDRLRQELGCPPDGPVAVYGNVESLLNGLPACQPDQVAPASEPQLDAAPRDGTQLRSPYIVTPALRGAAAGAWTLGADGIELFNVYAVDEDDARERICSRDNMRADYTAIPAVRCLDDLRGRPKQYALTTMLAPVWNPPFDLPDQVPAVLEPDWRRAFRLPMCAEPPDAGLRLVVQIVVDQQEELPPIGVALNDGWPRFAGTPTDALLFPQQEYTHHTPEHTAFNYELDVARLRDGWNEIAVYNGSHRRHNAADRRRYAITVRSVEVGVL